MTDCDWTALKILLCLGMLLQCRQIWTTPLNVVPWLLLSMLIVRDLHLCPMSCAIVSCVLVVCYGRLAELPWRCIVVLHAMELRSPTLGKRAREDRWKPEEHETYLRTLLAADPAIEHMDIIDAVNRDGRGPVERNTKSMPLRNWIDNVRKTPLTRAQLDEFYTQSTQDMRQQQPHLGPRGLYDRWHDSDH